jgi:hypothetical protein
MSVPIPLRVDFDASRVRGLTKKAKDGPQARRPGGGVAAEWTTRNCRWQHRRRHTGNATVFVFGGIDLRVMPPFWPERVALSRAWISERASMMVTLKRCLGSL